VYESPERGNSLEPDPRISDLWSIGCIILEFLIWLLYGWDELKYFRDILWDFGDVVRFYQPSGQESISRAKVHTTIVAWMDYMAKDQECSGMTALGALLWWVRQGLLIVEYGPDAVAGKDGDKVDEDSVRRTNADELRIGLTGLRDSGKTGITSFFTGMTEWD
jgi:hypothetical protein